MKTCKYINSTLVFTSERITPCYSCFAEKAPHYLKTGGSNVEIINFEEKRKQIIEDINSPFIREFPCNTCCQLIENNEAETKYKHIILSFWQDSPLKYNIFETIQNLYQQNLIDIDNLIVEFQSGNIDNFRELNKLIRLFEANGCKKINFLINNVSYKPIIEEILQKEKGSLSILFDSKDKESNKLHATAKTLKQYMESAKNKNEIKIYYTLIENGSTTKKDIKNFIELMFRIGINTLGLRLDHTYINEWINKDIPLTNCSKNFGELIIFFFKLAKKYSFYLDMDYTEQNIVLNKIFKTNKLQKLSLFEKIKKFFHKP